MDKIFYNYIFEKINQLLKVIGTKPINKDEISQDTLLELDPLGVIASTFETILENLQEKNQELQISNIRLKILLDTISDGIYIVDENYYIRFINESERNCLKEELKEIVNHKCYKVFNNLSEPCANCKAKNVLSSKSPCILKSMDFKEFRPGVDCKRKVVDVSFYPFEENQVLIYIKDFTEIYEKMKLINFEKEKLLVTLQSMIEGVIVVDENMEILLVNNSCEKFFGTKLEKVKERSLLETYPFLKKFLDSNSFKSNEIVYNDRILDFTVAPIVFENEIQGYVIVFRDITEKKKFQNEAQKIEKLEAVGLLAGGIAHDFNNILTGALGNLELCELFIDNKTKLSEKFRLLEKSLFRAKNLTEKLLTFSKGGEPVKDIIDIKDIIKESVNFVLSGTAIEGYFSFDEELHNVEVDPGQIYQVFSNLALNSKQALQGKGKIEIIAENCNDDKVKIIFRDNGPGIDKEILNKIFDPFFTTKKGNSGLGLSIIFNIIKKHNGKISVNSEQGNGTEFIIILPANKKNIIKNGKSPYGKKDSKEEKNILFMDDDAQLRKAMKEVLEFNGYKVYEAKNGEEAIEIFRNKKINLVILDLTIIGGMGGIETLKVLKKIDPNVKAIVSSGYSNDHILSNYIQQGFIGKLEKPYKIKEFVSLISKLA